MLPLLLAATVGLKPVCGELRLEATVSSDWRTVSGMARCLPVEQPPARVAAYPRVLAAPRALDDISRPWYYPAGFEPATMELWLGETPLSGSGAWQELPPRPAGKPVALRFVTHVPRRNGVFGRSNEALYLLGGWHPNFASKDAYDTAATTIRYRIWVPQGTVGFVGAQPFGHNSPRLLTGTFVGRYLPVLVAQSAEVQITAAAVLVAPTRPAKRSPPTAPPLALTDASIHTDRDAHQELLRSVADGASFARANGLSTPPLLLVATPLREHLCEVFDGGVAVSDRAFHLLHLQWLADLGLLPPDILLRFHRLGLWRAQLAAYARPLAQARETRLPGALAADFVASALLEDLAKKRYGGRTRAPDLLETFAVIPEIDALIFAPQITFVDSYFGAIDERSGRRFRIDTFANSLPRGKLLYERLVDLDDEAAALATAHAYLQGTHTLLDTAEARHAGARAYLSQWLGPPPLVDYSIGEVHTDGSGMVVSVDAAGPQATSLHEPVTVEVVDEAGKRHRAQRMGPGPVHIPDARAAERIEIDPAGRLVELTHPPGVGPRFNNRTPPRWRFLLNNISGLFAITGGQVNASVDFSLHRIHDLRYRFDFRLLYSPEAYGLSAAASYGLGEEVTPLRLAHRLGIGANVERLRPVSGAGRLGYQLEGQAFYSYDTRLSFYSSFEGQGLAALATGALGSGDDGTTHRFLRLGVSAFRLFPLSFYQALLLRIRADINLGDVPEQLGLPLGGRYTAGRGFEPDAARGDRRIIASVEHRHALAVDTRTDLFGLFTITRLEGALFADAIALHVQRQSCARNVFYDVGYGIRIIGDILNVSPGSLAIDAGVPLAGCGPPDGFPLTIYLAFVQSFLLF